MPGRGDATGLTDGAAEVGEAFGVVDVPAKDPLSGTAGSFEAPAEGLPGARGSTSIDALDSVGVSDGRGVADWETVGSTGGFVRRGDAAGG